MRGGNAFEGPRPGEAAMRMQRPQQEVSNRPPEPEFELDSNNRPEIEEVLTPPETDELPGRVVSKLEGRPPAVESVAESTVEAAEARRDFQEPKAFEKLPEELQVKLLDQMLLGMRKDIADVKDYAVFASTAMYLNGEEIKRRGDEATAKELMKPPGDFDAALYSRADLDAIRNRMREKKSEYIFANAKKDPDGKIMRDSEGEVIYDGKPGEYSSFPGQDLKLFAGKKIFDVEIDGKMEKIAYDFEFFLNSRVIPKDVFKGEVTESERLGGLKILNLEGLQKQYQRNLQFESRLDASIQKIVDSLHTTDPEDMKTLNAFKSEIMSIDRDGGDEEGADNERDIEEGDDIALTGETRELLQRLEVGPREMKRVFEIQDELDKIKEEHKQPFEKLAVQGLSELYIDAYRKILDDDDSDEAARAMAEQKIQELEKMYKHVQGLVSERATLLAGTKTKLWKRDLNLIQLARARGSVELSSTL